MEFHDGKKCCHSVLSSPLPLSAEQSENFSMLAKKGRLALFEFLGRERESKKGGVDFFRRDLRIFRKKISAVNQISHKIKNANYSNSHNHNVICLLTIFKCLQLVN